MESCIDRDKVNLYHTAVEMISIAYALAVNDFGSRKCGPWPANSSFGLIGFVTMFLKRVSSAG